MRPMSSVSRHKGLPMHDLLIFAVDLTAGLLLHLIIRAISAFERLGWADRTQETRLAMYCGVHSTLFTPVEPSPLYRWARS